MTITGDTPRAVRRGALPRLPVFDEPTGLLISVMVFQEVLLSPSATLGAVRPITTVVTCRT
ncbi:MAG: hypothetical protein ACRDL8_01810 [Solirubrobacteraceae bacterium]